VDNANDRPKTKQHTPTTQHSAGLVGENKQNSSIITVDAVGIPIPEAKQSRSRTQVVDLVSEVKRTQPNLQTNTLPDDKDQRMTLEDRKDLLSWAEEMELTQDAEVQTNQNFIQNPKHSKKLKLEKPEAKPPEKSKGRIQKASKQH
jgi:hypothetical protein